MRPSNKEKLLKTLAEISLGILGGLPTKKSTFTRWVYGKNDSATLGGFLGSKQGEDIAKSMKTLIVPMFTNHKNAENLAESAIKSVQSFSDARWLLEDPQDFVNKKGLLKAQPSVEDSVTSKNFGQYLEEKISAGVSSIASKYRTVKEVAMDSSKRVYLSFRIQEVEKKVEQVLNQEMTLHPALYDAPTRQKLYKHSFTMLLNAVFPRCGSTTGIKEAQGQKIYTIRMQYCQSLLSEATKKLLSHYGIDAQQYISSRGYTNLEEGISSMRTYKEMSEFIFDLGSCTPAFIGTEPINQPSTTDSKKQVTLQDRIEASSKSDRPLICFALLLIIFFTAGCIAYACFSPNKYGLSYFSVILTCIICAVATAICATLLIVNAARTSRVGVTHESSTCSEEEQDSVTNSCKSLEDLSLTDHRNKNRKTVST